MNQRRRDTQKMHTFVCHHLWPRTRVSIRANITPLNSGERISPTVAAAVRCGPSPLNVIARAGRTRLTKSFIRKIPLLRLRRLRTHAQRMPTCDAAQRNRNQLPVGWPRRTHGERTNKANCPDHHMRLLPYTYSPVCVCCASLTHTHTRTRTHPALGAVQCSELPCRTARAKFTTPAGTRALNELCIVVCVCVCVGSQADAAGQACRTPLTVPDRRTIVYVVAVVVKQQKTLCGRHDFPHATRHEQTGRPHSPAPVRWYTHGTVGNKSNRPK